MMHAPERDWMIVAPWWQWTDPASVPPGTPVVPDPIKGRLSQPVIQKYDSPNLVNAFIKNPQRSLKFIDDDLVHSVQARSGPSQSLAGRLLRLSARRDGTTIVDQQYLPDGTNTRKIFLNTHKRFYLVVGSIHCDGPGFPKVAREKICQAGFVVRRRVIDTARAGATCIDEVAPTVKALASTRAQLARVNQLAEIEAVALSGATGASTVTFSSAKLDSLVKTRGSLQALITQERARFEDWITKYHVVPELQGWFPSPKGFDKVGCWRKVAEMPDEVGLESSLPLYPLIPDDNDPAHAGHFGTIFFGLLPASSHECDDQGVARFDDQQFYEVRCWVKRHKVPHDADQPCPCPDGIFWSLPTRPYKLASHFDLTGTSNQPVTIQLPDLNELAAQAKPALGVGFAKPKGSLMVTADSDSKPVSQGQSPGFEICFFPIPLITIVASFVFQLFLPIIMLLFGLWWMLALKLCIPPEISIAGGITAEIGVSGKIGFDASLNVTVADGTTKSVAAVEGDIEGLVKADLKKDVGVDATNALLVDYSPIAFANAEIETSSAAKASDASLGAQADIPANAVSITAHLDYEPEVAHA
jgi:hypothetical protein